MKKLIALLMCLTLVFGIVACTTTPADEGDDVQEPAATDAPGEGDVTEPDEGEGEGEQAADIKVGFIFLHDENSTMTSTSSTLPSRPAPSWG